MTRYIVDLIGPTPDSETGRRYVETTDSRRAAMAARNTGLMAGSATMAGAEVFHTTDGYVIVVRERQS